MDADPPAPSDSFLAVVGALDACWVEVVPVLGLSAGAGVPALEDCPVQAAGPVFLPPVES